MVGNKTDLESQRTVSWARGQALADRFKVQFVEVSAKTGLGIEGMFSLLGEAILVNLRIRKDLGGLSKKSFKIIPSKEKLVCNSCLC